MPKKLTQNEFIIRARELFTDVNYDYSLVTYKNATTPVKIRCNIHDYTFEQKPRDTLKGNYGCKYCNKNNLTTEDYIYLAKKVHGDKFDYSQVTYTKMSNKIIVLCREHNLEFTQNAQRHLLGSNPCGKCNGQETITKENFIARAEEKHGQSKFDYSLIPNDFKGIHSKGDILCKKHGIIFTIDMWAHINNGVNGCPLCNKNSPYDLNKLITNAIKKHNGTNFDYSKVDFSQGSKNKVTIGCTIHNNYFEQTIDLHVSGRNGCTECTLNGTSKKEIEMADFIESLGVTIERNKRKLLPNLGELDVFIPHLNTAFEFNGLFFHNENMKGKYYHYNKTKICMDNGIRLLHIWEDDWDNRREIVEEHIRHVLNMSERRRIYARQTIIKNVPKTVAQDFYNLYHIQGFVSASVHIGLFETINDDSPVAVMSFMKSKNNYVLSRYATCVNVIGGHSKLLHYFEGNYSYDKLITFADLSFSYGNLYSKTGWVKDEILPADYSYVINNRRVHKFNYRKHRFKDDPLLNYQDNMTEKELADLNGLSRIWDAGKIKFIKNSI